MNEILSHMFQNTPFDYEPTLNSEVLFQALLERMTESSDFNKGLGNYYNGWYKKSLKESKNLEDLPFLPIRVFKSIEPLSLVNKDKIYRSINSSSTSSQLPSTVVLDQQTAKDMTKSSAQIFQSFIGDERRNFFIVDSDHFLSPGQLMTARSAAIRSLIPFSKGNTVAFSSEPATVNPDLVVEKFLDFIKRSENKTLMIYGFTHLIWTHLFLPLKKAGVQLDLENVVLLHSGGWKKLQDISVSKEIFNLSLKSVLGVEAFICDFYGLVENVGVVYPDCEAGYKHVPVFGNIIIRQPKTLEPCSIGEPGLIQFMSLLPSSFPGHSVLTEDLGTLRGLDHCKCGRRGKFFEFIGRVPRVEVRGCANIDR